MVESSVTRQDLIDAVCHKATLSRTEAAGMVGQVLAEICDTLTSGESVKLSGFGRFEVRAKGQRVGRNPKTKEAVPIEPRQVVLFRPSPVLRARINDPSNISGAGTSSWRLSQEEHTAPPDGIRTVLSPAGKRKAPPGTGHVEEQQSSQAMRLQVSPSRVSS